MRKILIFFFAFMASLGLRAATVSFSSVEGSPGDTVTVSVRLTGSEAIANVQLAIPLDASTHYVDGSAALTARRADHSITAREADGTLNIVVLSSTMAALKGTDGPLLTFKLCLGRMPETLALSTSKLIATGTDGKAVTCSATAGSVTTRCARALLNWNQRTMGLGRQPIRSKQTYSLYVENNGNAPLVITGFRCTSKDYTIDDNLPMTVNAGDGYWLTLGYLPMERGTVTDTMTLVSNSISRLNYVILNAQPYAVNELHVLPAEGLSDSTVTVHVTMNNMDAITGLQMAFDLPEEVRYVDGSFRLSGRSNGHTLHANLSGTTLTAVAYSASEQAFTGNEGEIATFKLRLVGPNSTTLNFSKAILTAKYKGRTMDVKSDVYGADVAILSPRISTVSDIAMGRTPITETAAQPFTIYNYGLAPLRIDRATYSADGLAIKEKLPVEVPAGEGRMLTVVTTDSVQKAIEAAMRLYCNDPAQRMVPIILSGSRFITNAITLSAPTAFIGHQAEVQVALENTFDIKALQMDVLVPHATFTLATDNPYAKTRRMGDMMVTTRTVGDTVKVRAFSLTDKAIAHGSGPILSLFFDVKDGNAEGSASFAVTNIKLSRTSTEEVHSDLTPPTTQVEWLRLGDVNKDGVVDITDASGIARMLSGQEVGGFRSKVADVNDDKTLDITDAYGIAKYLVGLEK